MRITDYPDLLRTKGAEPMPQAWDADKQDWTPAIDSAATLEQIKTAMTDGTQKVALTGTLTELFGASLSDRPPASSVSVGVTFMVVGTDIVYQSNGTDWVVIS